MSPSPGAPARETGNPAPAIYTPAHLISPTFNALIGADTLVKLIMSHGNRNPKLV